ncbi:MAG: TRAP transporter small permease [Magnetospirillum sp.]|jgi:TRAP-type C4-dicarboxylate transport system permease small subunit|nr:TRAP transporter small permease [Magnetospirillum sp.]
MLDRLYVRVIEVLVFVAITAMVGIGFLSTAIRSVPGWGGLYWAEEIIRYACIWMVFLCSGLTIRYGIHFRVDLVLAKLPRRAGIALALFAVAVMIWFEVVLIWFGSKVTIMNMEQQSTSLEFPMGYVYVAIPIGGVLMLFETLRLGWTIWNRGEPIPASEQPLVD